MTQTITSLSKINDTKHSLFIDMCNGILGKLGYSPIKSREQLSELRKIDKSAIVALLDKCDNMIFCIGSPNSIEGFLKRVATKKKKQTQPGFRGDSGEFLGVTHFRWDWQGYELTEPELLALKSYLNMNDNSINPHFVFVFGNYEVKAGIKEIGTKWSADDKGLHNKFIVRVTNTHTQKSVKFDFYGSQNDYSKGVQHLDSDDLKNALECFLSDAMSGDMGFSEFCSEFGYQIDSRNAKKIHKACIKSKNKAAKIFEDLYDTHNALNETN